MSIQPSLLSRRVRRGEVVVGGGRFSHQRLNTYNQIAVLVELDPIDDSAIFVRTQDRALICIARLVSGEEISR